MTISVVLSTGIEARVARLEADVRTRSGYAGRAGDYVRVLEMGSMYRIVTQHGATLADWVPAKALRLEGMDEG